jgi:hypothetical protein
MKEALVSTLSDVPEKSAVGIVDQNEASLGVGNVDIVLGIGRNSTRPP